MSLAHVSTQPTFDQVVSPRTFLSASLTTSTSGPLNLATALTKPKSCSPTTASGSAEPKALASSPQQMR